VHVCLHACVPVFVRARLACRACVRVSRVLGTVQVLPFVDHDSPLQAYFPAARLALLFPVLSMVLIGIGYINESKHNAVRKRFRV
jgi:hypothetical protein